MSDNHSHQQLDINVDRLHLTDIDIYVSGFQNCEASYYYGPAVRDHYLIHYIYEGKGKFEVNNKVYQLHTGQGFLICPDIVTYYEADEDDPWTYAWIGFNGLKAESYLKQASLTQKNPIFSTDPKNNSIESIFKKMNSTKNLKMVKEIKLLGLLYLFLAELNIIRNNNKLSNSDICTKEIYLKKAVEYIAKNHYNHNLSISKVSSYIGVNRGYLWSIFKDYLNLSPQEFLINFRMDRASKLLKNNSLSVADISRSVGYQDPLTFSKIFKKVKGIPPSKYRKDL